MAHRYWRVAFYASAGGYTEINEVEMHTSIGGGQACSGGTALSSGDYSGYGAAKAFDSSTLDANGWCSAGAPSFATPTYVGYDFGAGNDRDIVEVKLFPYSVGTDYPTQVFTVDYSDNGSAWTTAWYCWPSNWSGITWNVYTLPSGPPARYWRVYAAAMATVHRFDIYQLEMHSIAGGSQICTGGTAIADSTHSTFVPAYAFDGVDTNQWESAWYDAGSWIGYDFGAGNNKTVNEIKLLPFGTPADYEPTVMSVQWSSDGISWVERWSIGSTATSAEVANTWITFTYTAPPITVTLNGGWLGIHDTNHTAGGGVPATLSGGSLGIHSTVTPHGGSTNVIMNGGNLGIHDTLSVSGGSFHISSSLSDGVVFRSSTEHVSATRALVPLIAPGSLGVHPTQSQILGRTGVASDHLRLHDTVTEKAIYNILLNASPLHLHDAFYRAFPVSLSGGSLGLHASAIMAWSVFLAEKLKLHDVLVGSAHYDLTISDRIKLSSVLGHFIGASLGGGNLGVHDHPSIVYQAVPVVSPGSLGLHATTVSHRLVFAITNDSINLHDSEVLSAIYNQTLSDGVKLFATYISPGGGITTWAINMRTGSTTEYQNYNFNSFAKMGNKYLGASAGGLYELDGASDAGTPIIADILGGFAQFGGSHYASLKQVYLGVRGGGDFVLKIIEGTGKTRFYGVNAKDMRTTRVDLGKGLRSRYFAYELISTGQDFDLDSIEFVPLIMQRRV